MSERTESLGFHTPNKIIQDKLNTKLDDIEKNLGDWKWVAKKAKYLMCKKDFGEVDHKALYAWLILNLAEIAQLGQELAKIHEDIARVEKSLKELRRATR